MKSAFQRKRNLLTLEDLRFYAVVAEAFFIALSPWLASAAAIVALVLWLIQMKLDPDLHFRRLPFDKVILVFLAFAVASLFASPKPMESFTNFIGIVGIYMVTYLVAGQTIRTSEQLRHVVEAFALGAIIVVLYGFYQFVFGINVSDVKWTDPEAFPELRKRVFSTWLNPNILAGYLNEAIAMALAFLVTMKERSTRVIIGVGIVCLMACLAMTYARGAMIALAITVGLYGLLRDWRILAGLVVVCVVLLCVDPMLWERLTSIFTKVDTSAEMRLAIWESTGDMIRDHPFIGIGWGSYILVYPEYDFYINDAAVKIYHAHNMYLNYAAEIGLFGAAAYFVNFFGTMVKAVKKSMTDDDQFLKAFRLGIVLAFTTIALGGFTDYVLFNIPSSMLFWMLCALTFAEPSPEDEVTRHDALKEALRKG